MGGFFSNRPISRSAVSGPNMPSSVPAPAAPALGQSAGGVLGATTYGVKITYVTAQGESLASAEASFAVSANNVLVVTSPAAQASVPINDLPATGYNVYATVTPGANWQKQNAASIAIGTPWTEPTTGLIAGVAPPTTDTSQFGGQKQVTKY